VAISNASPVWNVRQSGGVTTFVGSPPRARMYRPDAGEGDLTGTTFPSGPWAKRFPNTVQSGYGSNMVRWVVPLSSPESIRTHGEWSRCKPHQLSTGLPSLGKDTLDMITVRGAVLMLMGRHDGVMASCDGARPESTQARLCTLVARLCPMVAGIGARTLRSLWVIRGGVRGHTRRGWATGAVHASHGRLIIPHNGGMTFARRLADAEDELLDLNVGLFSASWVTGATPRQAVAPRH